MPTNLQERFKEALQDPDWLSSRDEIALFQVRIFELVERLNSGEGNSLWSRLKTAYDLLTAAREEGDSSAAAAALNDIGLLIEAGESYQKQWNEVFDLSERQAAMRQQEVRRLTSVGNMVTLHELAAILASLEETIRRNIEDPDVRRRIAQGFVEVINVSAPAKAAKEKKSEP